MLPRLTGLLTLRERDAAGNVVVGGTAVALGGALVGLGVSAEPGVGLVFGESAGFAESTGVGVSVTFDVADEFALAGALVALDVAFLSELHPLANARARSTAEARTGEKGVLIAPLL